MRINKYISATGLCSRRAAEQWIQDGRVLLNGALANINSSVEDGDTVSVDGKEIVPNEEFVYIALHKPKGITCTTERHVEGNIIDFIKYPKRIFPIGRLDKDSTGIILLTNDGSIVNDLLREENNHTKEYMVTVDRTISEELIAGFAQGVQIYNPVGNCYVVTKPCKVQVINARTFKTTLTQGYNRQLRRMCTAFGYQVVKLHRLRFMHLALDGLAPGTWRELAAEEVQHLKKDIADGVAADSFTL